MTLHSGPSRHRQLLLGLFLCLSLSGPPACSLFQPQTVPLAPGEVDAIAERVGALTLETRQAWIDELNRVYGETVLAVRQEGDEIVAVLSPPLEAAAAEAGGTWLDEVAQNPTPAGIVTGSIAALFAAAWALQRREARGGKK